jgi:hypothetical protein
MLQSHLIEADGVFLGAAVRLDRGYRFVAVDLRVEALDETIWPDLAEIRRLARHLYLTGRFPEATPPGAPPMPGEAPRVAVAFGV